jgi:hypothetical protein
MPLPAPSHYAPIRPSAAERFALWVDGVGGYLVCLRDSAVLGQCVANNPVDIAFQADLSRKHAVIRRQHEAYFIDPIAAVRVGNREITSPTLLNDSDELQLGNVVRLRFRRPHPLSATARLEPVSYHRPRPGVDAVLLMSESCVLGPRWQNHVVCRDWANDLVLARQAGQLFCRTMQPIEIDGTRCDGRGKLAFDSRITGDDFSLCLEPM